VSSRYVQTAEAILATPTANYSRINGMMGAILELLTDAKRRPMVP